MFALFFFFEVVKVEKVTEKRRERESSVVHFAIQENPIISLMVFFK